MEANIHLDSRQVLPGDTFLAVPGEKYDGRRFIDQALQQGAVEVYAHAPCQHPKAIEVADLKDKVPEFAAKFYNYPARDLKIIGITGTNGKTSCSHYIAQILSANNLSCGVMGTLGNGTVDNLVTSNLTTSDSCTIHRQFADFKRSKIKHVAMEVSSHALIQNRLAGIDFDVAIFTNLSQDHLDYHANMQDYFAAKSKLFTEFAPSNCIINLDDPYAAQLLTLIPSSSKIITYSLSDPCADVYLDNYAIQTQLIGRFNLSNLLACIACCEIFGLSTEQILTTISKLTPVSGRMQVVQPRATTDPLVVVDYAHTPDALVNALQTLREIADANVYCVFGCGGDRDRSKRPLMLDAALRFSDKVIVTMDNPRTESPAQIIDDILDGQEVNAKICVETDRAAAIAMAIAQAGANDIVLIAGKGHEDYQIIGTQKNDFSDLLVARQALESRS